MKVETLLEFARQKIAAHDDHVYHLIDVTAEQAKRVKNDGPQPKTRFQIELGDAELYRQWNLEKDRILKRVGNKSIALTLMQRAWSEALCDSEIDKILAEQEGPEFL
jgi:hypothetical protein